MKGEFVRKKFSFPLLLLLSAGVFDLWGAFRAEQAGAKTFLGIVGAFAILIAILVFLWNFGAYFIVEDDRVRAKYHWFGKLDCKLSDICYAGGKLNALTIVLKSGRTQTVMGISNSYALAAAIRRGMTFDVTEPPEILIERLNKFRSARKKDLICTCALMAITFINIFVTVFLTNEKEMSAFGRNDWIIFAFMCAAELIAFVVMLFFAQKAGKKLVPIDQLDYSAHRRTIETTAVLPGAPMMILADDDYSCRVSVFGLPDGSGYYYIIEVMLPDYSLKIAEKSKIYEELDQLPFVTSELNDITDVYYH